MLDEMMTRAASRWVDRVQRRPIKVVASCLVATLLILAVSHDRLALDSNEEALFGRDLPFVRMRAAFAEAFPQLVDPIIIVLDGPDVDRVASSADALAARLRHQPERFPRVIQPGGGPFFEAHGLLYLSTEEVEELVDRLAQVQPYLAELSQDLSLRGLLQLLAEGLDQAGEGALPTRELAAVLDQVSATFEAHARNRPQKLPWAELIFGDPFLEQARGRFLLVQPVLDFSDLRPAAVTLNGLREVLAELGLDGTGEVRARMTGTYVLSAEEAEHVAGQSRTAGVVAFVLVALTLTRGLRSGRMVSASLVTLLVGLAWTAGFAVIAVGHLSLISVTFGVLFIGLSIDFAIHLCVGYRELVLQGLPLSRALPQAAGEVGASLALCALTTAIGFYAFVPTEYLGMAELGLIAGTGMFISLFTNLTLLPALLALWAPPARIGPATNGPSWLLELQALPVRNARVVAWASLLLAAAAVPLALRLEFDANPLRVRDPTTESVQTFDDLLAEGKAFPWNISALMPNLVSAQALAAELERLPSVKQTVTLHDFVPEDQLEKLALLADAELFLEPALRPSRNPEPSRPHEASAALDRLQRTLDAPDTWGYSRPEALGRAADRLGAAIAAFRAGRFTHEAHASAALEALEEDLVGTLAAQLDRLQRALQARAVEIGDLPDDLVSAMVAQNGRVRIEIFPSEDLNDSAALERYVREVQGLAPEAFGEGIVILASGKAVVQALVQALSTAAILILALLLLLWRDPLGTLLVMLPLTLAGLLTGALSVLLEMPLNFANVIVVPLLLGMGVDTGIHLVHRRKGAALPDGNLLRTGTARAALFSGLTTIASFGVLGLSSHPGMASMGRLLALGIGLVLACNLVVLPALVTLWRPRQA